jgi:hypothetical protein
MKHPTPFRLSGGRAVVAAVAAMALTGMPFAAGQAAKPLAAKPAAAPRVPRAPRVIIPKIDGLDGLDDSVLGAELSGRGINGLLDYYFKANHVTLDQQQAIRTFGALGELRRNGDKIPYQEKLRRVKEVADGVDAVLPSLKDPNEMRRTAGTLKEFGVDRDVNNIEYWGSDPVTQAHLKPLGDAMVKLLAAASSTAEQQATDLANKLTGRPNDPNADRWEKMDNLSHTAAYEKNMAVYSQCLGYDVKDPARKELADKAITALTDYDTADSTVQPRVRNMIAKLQMVSGQFDEARKSFQSVSDEKSTLVPAPNPIEQYEARYFTVVTDVVAQKLAEAKSDKAALDAWQTTELPKLLAAANLSPAAIAENKKGIESAGQMLEWRVDVLEGDLTKVPAEKKKADDAAEAVLAALRITRPDLAPIIDEQLVKRMPANKVIDDKMPTSLLLALLKKGMVESYKQNPDKPDPVVLNKAIEAAGFIVRRQAVANSGITPAQVDEASLSVPLLEDRMGKFVEAANGYLDYAVAYSKINPKKSSDALDRAGFLVFDLKKTAPVGWEDLYAKFLPIAIGPPFNHKELAYAYGEHLRGLKNLAEAMKFYRLVPPTDRFFASAQYKIMLVLGDMLDTKQDPAAHKQTVAELMTAAEEVKKLGDNPKDVYDRSKAVQATLVLADLARIEEKNPAHALQVLQGFEALVKGLPGEAELLRGAMVARINCDMAVGSTNQAVEELTKLIATSKEGEGIALVRQLLDQLDKEFANANMAHNIVAERVTAKNEALLTHYLVDWSKKTPSVAQFYYAYAVYDARTQRLAGSLAEDPVERKKLLVEASDRFRGLQTKEMHALYIAQKAVKDQIDAGALSPDDGDPQVATGLALTEFDLGNYKGAKEQLDGLIANKKLGTPQTESIDPATGERKLKDNDLYWEGTLKSIKSSYEVAKAANDAKALAVAAQSLKNMLVRGGIPDRWQEGFESLRKDLAPDYNPNAPIAAQKPATQTAATAGPVSAK